MTTLRTASAQQSQTIVRLESTALDLERQNVLLVSQEKTAKASLKSAESRNRVLKEDMSRLKSTVGQIRAQCANDVRKRDAEVKRLQKHLEVRRGREGSVQVGVTVVTPGITKPRSMVGVAEIQSSGGGVHSTSSPSYSLKEETTDFLTQLSQSLSDENDALIALAQSTLAALHDLQGLSPPPSPTLFPQSQSQSQGQQKHHHQSSSSTSIFTTPEESDAAAAKPTSTIPSHSALAAHTTRALTHLRALLTNPSFVPLEEVEAREEQIARLRAGWERMEARWSEAVGLMRGWRARMERDGDRTINLEELRRGLDLGGMREEEVAGLISGDEVKKEGVGKDEDVQGGKESVTSESSVEVREKEEEERQDEVYAQTMQLPEPASPFYLSREHTEDAPIAAPRAPTVAGLVGVYPAPAVLRATTGNARRPSLMLSPPARFTTIRANSPRVGALLAKLGDVAGNDDDVDAIALLDGEGDGVVGGERGQGIGEDEDEDGVEDGNGGGGRVDNENAVRRELSVEEKLARAQWEAEEARAKVRREEGKVEEEDSTRRKDKEARDGGDGQVRAVKRTAIPRKVGRAKRRSTLSPEELESLMGL